MAKQDKNSNLTETDDIFAKMLAQHNKIMSNAATLGSDMNADVKMWIPTGAISLDTIISNKPVGGWPAGRIVELYGEEAYGKSTICYQGMANCQKMGGIVIFYDIENAATRDLMEACGVDFSKVLVSNLETVEDIFDTMQQNLTLIAQSPKYKDKPVFVCIDSLAAMKTKQQIEGDYDFNMNIALMFAKQLGSALKRILPYLNKANATLIIINQLRDKPGTMLKDPKVTPGGNALKFYASVRIRLLGKKPIEVFDEAIQENIPIGYEVTARTDKNKCGPPKRKADFQLIFTKGIVETPDWLNYAVNLGLITRGGAWYTITDKLGLPSYTGQKFQSKSWEDFLGDAEFYNTLREKLIQGFIRPKEEILVAEDTEDIEDIENVEDIEDAGF
jgi:recombination protein RecA